MTDIGQGSYSLAVKATAILALSLILPALAEEPLPQVERLKTSPVLRHLAPNPVPAEAKGPGVDTLRQMYVPPGFQVDLIAAEPDVRQPIAFAFDERGRIWVLEAHSYPQKQPEGQGKDRVLIFADNDGDGRFETRKVFVEGLNLASAIEVGHGGVWIGAAPQFLFLPDADHDDKPDGPAKVLLDGFGYQDTHECLNSFLWGPDGWLYGNQGVFNYAKIGKPGSPDSERTEMRAGVWRYHPTRDEFEVFAHGGSNPWGLDYDENGELFMTHCRSYFGGGCTTHIIQGGHYWNQTNSNHAPYIIAEPPREYPGLRNYLLASARYDHGAGGAGKPGSDAIYGGHSHCGTLLYYGGNWPAEYRGHLFTINLGGHQINHQVNLRVGSGYETVHQGRDMFFCTDPKFVGVDLQTGPDGAVYFIDWHDAQHCHNPNSERWDRSDGRIYRMKYHGDRPALSAPKIRSPRLRELFDLHQQGTADYASFLADPDEHVRAWAIRLAVDRKGHPSAPPEALVELARVDPSPVVRLALASALPRVPDELAWRLGEALAQRGEDATDRNLPCLLWHGLAPLLPREPARAMTLAQSTLIPSLADWIHWRAAGLGGEGLNLALARLGSAKGEEQRRLMACLALAIKAQPNMPMPTAWSAVAKDFYASKDPRVVRQAEELAAVFGDESMFPKLRAILADTAAKAEDRQHAFAVLSRARDQRALPTFLHMLGEPTFRANVINLLAKFDAPEIPPALLRGFEGYAANERAAALNTLTSRPSFALPLLDAVAAKTFPREHLNAFHIRQLAELNNPEIDKRIAATWGKIGSTSAEKQALIAKLEKAYNEAPLWAYDVGAGRRHFQQLCAACHRLGEEGERIGPELTGAGKHGIRYYLENLIDPNAVVGTDFQITTVETKQGGIVLGMVTQESAEALSLRTLTESVTLAKTDIAKRSLTERSLMPEGLLESLPPREQIELLKYLLGH